METTYLTQNGDSLWSIAQQFYADGNQWNAIYEANRSTIGDKPDYLQAGWTLTIPDLPIAPPAGQSYITTDADTLWDIAVRFYGDGAQWPKIYEANRTVIGADPNVLTGGLTLQIPA